MSEAYAKKIAKTKIETSWIFLILFWITQWFTHLVLSYSLGPVQITASALKDRWKRLNKWNAYGVGMGWSTQFIQFEA